MTIHEERKNALRRRTKAFAGSVVKLYITLDQRREEPRVLGEQLPRSGISVAANYRESSRARSPDEFIAKIELCAQEGDDDTERLRWRVDLDAVRKDGARRVPVGCRSSQSQPWLELLRADRGVAAEIVSPVWKEADELISIFVTRAKTAKERMSAV